MANESVKKFIDMIKQDNALRASIQREMLSAGSAEAALARAATLAADKGLVFSGDELKSSLPEINMPAAQADQELSDAQLESVAGGYINWAKACTGSSTLYCYICAMGTTGA